MKTLSKLLGILVGLTLLSTNLLGAPAELLMGYMKSGKFYYNRTQPIQVDFNTCVGIYGGCAKVIACGYNYYYPKLDSMVRGYMRENASNAVEFVNYTYKKKCLKTND